MSFAIPTVLALAVGTCTMLAARPELVHQVTFRLEGDGPLDGQDSHRDQLLQYAATLLATTATPSTQRPRWFVDSPGEGLLRLLLVATETRGAAELAAEIAVGFPNHAADRAKSSRETPTEAERILSNQLEELTARYQAARTEMDAAVASMPVGDPNTERAAVLKQWRALRAEYSQAREEVTLAAAGFEQLRSGPEPSYGVVTTNERREAFDADLVLQQDLRELAVTLSELRSHMLRVRDSSRQRLDWLIAMADGLNLVASNVDTTDLTNLVRKRVDGLTARAARYDEELADFAEAWSSEFDLARNIRIDAQSGEMLDLYFRVRSLLNDFLYAAAGHLSGMRDQIAGLEENLTESARYHVLHSNLARSFRTLQGAHHRFEFTAGGLDTPGNFRLDAALRSASGLRRRSQTRLRIINERLEVRALSRAKKTHLQAIARTQRFLDSVRGETDQTVDQLVALQDKLTVTAGLSEEFAAAVVRAELGRTRLRQTRLELERTRDQRDDLTRARLSPRGEVTVELVSASVIDANANSGERIRNAGIATLITLLSILFGQWSVLRRKS